MAEEMKPHTRSAKNILLQPTLQIRLGLMSVTVAVFFAIIMGFLAWFSLRDFYAMVLELTDLREEIAEILGTYVDSMLWWFLGLLFLYLMINVFLSVYYTHRLVGPTFAFRRHCKALIAGNYASRVVLRKNDAFAEVAEVLNELAQHLQEKNQ